MSAPAQPSPPVSVVVPTVDRPALLRRAVESILGQDYPGLIEVIVVYDGPPGERLSYPETALRKIRKLSNTRSPGPAGARNTGIFATDRELVAFCDDDDFWAPQKLRRQVDALSAHPEAEMVGCGVEIDVLGQSRIRIPRGMWISRAELLEDRSPTANNSTVLVTKGLMAATGGFDEAIPGSYGEDYDLLLRAAARHPILMVQQPLVTLLWGPTSHFAERWETVQNGLQYLLAKHPELAGSGPGFARIAGQIAFAAAARQDRGESLSWARRAIRRNPLEPRAYLALAVASGMVSARRIVESANRRGRGV